jgi:putative ABC transport system permease protein
VSRLRGWLWRAADPFLRQRRERDLAAEIESHIQIHTEDNIRAGMSPDEARRAALAKLGGIEPLKEHYRDQRGIPALRSITQDLRYAARTLRRSPGVALVAVVTLAFGLAGPTVMFSMLDAWILDPLPFERPESLADVRGMDVRTGDTRVLSAADFLDWQRSAHAFDDLAAYRRRDVRLTGGDRADRVRGAQVTPNFFAVLGARAAIGRVFGPVDGEHGGDPVAVLGHGLWQERFQSDPGVIGRSIRIDGDAYTVIGVLPHDFHFTLLGPINVWTPLGFSPVEAVDRRARSLTGVGRLRPGYTIDQARHELSEIARRLSENYPQTNASRGARVLTLADEVRLHHDAGFVVPVLFAMVGCFLLIACVNVTNIMLARATDRRHEMAVRLALGASRARIVRQSLVEHIVLFSIASAIAVVLALYGANWITSSIPADNRGYLRNYGVLPIDGSVLAFAAASGFVCAIVFGLAPAVTGSRADVNTDLRDASVRTSTGHAAGRLRSGLVACELALALGVLISSALLVRSARNLTTADLGFNRRQLLTFRLELDQERYRDGSAARDFYERLTASLHGRPGIDSAAAGTLVPFSNVGGSLEFFVDGRRDPASKDVPFAALNAVTPAYPVTLGLHVIEGRFVNGSDTADAPRVAVINETLASRYFAGGSAIGRTLLLGPSSPDQWTIVGIVGNVKNYETSDSGEPQIYLSHAQRPARDMTVVVRASGDPASLVETVRGAVLALDPAEPLSRVFTMDALLGHVTAPYTITASFASFLGALTLLLAAVGVYGVISYAFAQRTREIGIRMALGARRSEVAALVMRQVRTLLLAGLVPGLTLAWLLGQAMKALLFGVAPTDWRVYAAMSTLLAAIAVLAAVVPVRRATSIDPIAALRE